MKMSPVSGDMMVKIALGGAVLYMLYLASQRAGKAATDAANAVANAVTTGLNPADRGNIVYRSVNAVGGTVAGSSDWSLGAAVYNATHPAWPATSTPSQNLPYNFGITTPGWD